MIPKFVIAFFATAAILFIPAGTLKWVEAWLYIIIQFSFSGYVAFWALKHSPGLIKSRMSTKLPVKTFDKVIMSIFIVTVLALILVPGFDFRYGWSEVPIFVEILGFIGLILSLYALFLTMAENPFLSKIIEIQKKQKQRVITTGPYSYVRHPMYAVMFVFFPAFALALGSYYTLIPSALSIILLIIRTYFEDVTLQKELKGYKEYARKVRYRFLPGIW